MGQGYVVFHGGDSGSGARVEDPKTGAINPSVLIGEYRWAEVSDKNRADKGTDWGLRAPVDDSETGL